MSAIVVSRHEANDRAIVSRYVKSLATDVQRSTQPDREILVWGDRSEGGRPSTDERRRMVELKGALAPTIEGDGFATLALVSTGAHVREWIHYARSADAFREKPNLAPSGRPAFPIEIHMAHDPAWTTCRHVLSDVVAGDGR